jgi:integrase
MKRDSFIWTAPKLIRNSTADNSHILRYTVNKKVYRIRSGACINRPDLKPNLVKGVVSKKMWNTLLVEITKMLEREINPMTREQRTQIAESGISLGDLFKSALEQKCKARMSVSYKRDLTNRGQHFLKYISEKDYYDIVPEEFHSGYAHQYLDQYNNHSETYYNNVKRAVAVIFQLGVERNFFKYNPFSEVKLKKQVERKHVPFSSEQIAKLMNLMTEEKEDNLKLVCHLTYFSFLRPGQEVRLLKRGDFTDDFSKIILPGSRTKNRQRKVVNVHSETLKILQERKIESLHPDSNIFTCSQKPLNEYYFNTRWARFKTMDKNMGLDPETDYETIIQEGQSLYSFRHSAAIAFYKKYKDIGSLKRAMSHGSVAVTEKYLRGLGVLTSEYQANVPFWTDSI